MSQNGYGTPYDIDIGQPRFKTPMVRFMVIFRSSVEAWKGFFRGCYHVVPSYNLSRKESSRQYMLATIDVEADESLVPQKKCSDRKLDETAQRKLSCGNRWKNRSHGIFAEIRSGIAWWKSPSPTSASVKTSEFPAYVLGKWKFASLQTIEFVFVHTVKR